MKDHNLKKYLARILVVCMLLGDTLPALAAQNVPEDGIQEAVSALTDETYVAADVATDMEVQKNDETTVSVSAGDAMPQDAAETVQGGELLTPTVKVEGARTTLYAAKWASLAEYVVDEAVITVTGTHEGEDYNFKWNERWSKGFSNATMTVQDSDGTEYPTWYNLPANSEGSPYKMTLTFSKGDWQASGEISFEVKGALELPSIKLDQEYALQGDDYNWFQVDIENPGYYRITATEKVYADFYWWISDSDQSSNSDVLPNISGESNVTDIVIYNAGTSIINLAPDQEYFQEGAKFKLTEVPLVEIEDWRKTNDEIIIDYGTWGYNVWDGVSVSASGNTISASSNTYGLKMLKRLGAVFENSENNIHAKYVISNYRGSNDQEEGELADYDETVLWQALHIQEELTRKDGKPIEKDSEGNLPEGDYVMTYTAQNSVSLQVPFRIKKKVPVKPTKVTLDPGELEMKAGQDVPVRDLLTATVSPANANTDNELTYVSSNQNVVAVYNNRYDGTDDWWIHAVNTGTATIKVITANGKNASCKVTVVQGDTSYRIQYEGNGADSGLMYNQWFDYSEEKALTANTYVKTGYTFTGWNTSANGKGKAYADKQNVKELTTEDNGKIILYAQWKPVEYEIQYASGASDATGTMKSLQTSYDKTVALTANGFRRAGYVFDHWSAANGKTYTNKEKITGAWTNSDQPLVLTAVWTPIEYKITYVDTANDKYNEILNPNPATYNVTSSIVSLSDPSRAGYDFKGWYLSKADMKDETKKVTELTTAGKKNVTLYSKWEGKTTTIEFVATIPAGESVKGGAVPAKMEVTLGKTKTIPAASFKAGHYVFDGWNTKDDGTGIFVANKGSIPGELVEKYQGQTVRLYMHWKPMEYKITYKNAIVGKAGVEKNDSDPSYNIKTGFVYLDSAPVRPGYEFKGWYSKSSMKDTEKITSISTTSLKPVTVYAKWEAKQIAIRYNANKPAKAPSTYTVTGSMSDQTVIYGKTKTFSAAAYKLNGYTFVGWSMIAKEEYSAEDDLFKNKEVIPADVVDLYAETGSPLTLYAVWKPVEYKINYVSAVDGKQGVKNNNAKTYTVENSVIKANDLEAPSRLGYQFKGWYTDKKFTNELTELSLVGKKSVSVYAKWEAQKYIIRYNGGEYGYEESYSQEAVYGKAVKLLPNRFTSYRGNFAGWSLKQEAGAKDKIYKDKASVKNLLDGEHEYVGYDENDEKVIYIDLYAQWK